MLKPHIHTNAIIAFAKGATIETRSGDGPWYIVKHPSFNTKRDYRVHDPLRFLKQAHAEGSTIECRPKDQPGKTWKVVEAPGWLKGYEYRVAPEPKRITGEVFYYHQESRIALVNLTIDALTGDIVSVGLIK